MLAYKTYDVDHSASFRIMYAFKIFIQNNNARTIPSLSLMMPPALTRFYIFV